MERVQQLKAPCIEHGPPTDACLGMLLVLLMFMAGCIYNDTPEWGTGDGQVRRNR